MLCGSVHVNEKEKKSSKLTKYEQYTFIIHVLCNSVMSTIRDDSVVAYKFNYTPGYKWF